MNFEFKEKYNTNDLIEIVRILRSPDGCPWDKVQTHQSIRKDFIEEVYEAVDAIDAADSEHLREELGDVLLQVVFHSVLAEEENDFVYEDVVDAGVIREYALAYVTSHRAALSKMKDYKELLRNIPGTDQIINDFVKYAANKGIPARWQYIHKSQDLITSLIKAFIARDILGQSAFYPILNRNDNTIEAAIKALNKHKAAFPIRND